MNQAQEFEYLHSLGHKDEAIERVQKAATWTTTDWAAECVVYGFEDSSTLICKHGDMREATAHETYHYRG